VSDKGSGVTFPLVRRSLAPTLEPSRYRIPKEVDVEAVWNAHGGVLWRALVAMSAGRRDVADDAVAEAFTRLYAHRHRVTDPAPWLFRTAFRIAAADLKRERRHLPVDDSRLSDRRRESAGLSPELVEALRGLSDRQRVVVFLHYQADLPIAEVAHLTGSTVTAVKVRLHRARRALHADLTGEETASV
jgi:RNA polymerase sigma-70 factor (ECF subfamily)